MISKVFILFFLLFLGFFVTQFTIPWIQDKPVLPLFRKQIPHDDDFLMDVVEEHLGQLDVESELSEGVDKVVVDYRRDQLQNKLEKLTNKDKKNG